MKLPQPFQHWLTDMQRRRDERCRKRREVFMEFLQEHVEFHRQSQAFQQNYVGDRQAFHQRQREFLKKHQEFHRIHQRVKHIRPFIILFNLALWYLLIRYWGIGTLGTAIAVLLSIAGVYEFLFLRRLEKRVFEPIDKLRKGVEEIAKGNYAVRVEYDVFNDLTLLVASFNEMAGQLQENEKIKAGYEENRKALLANISHDLKTPITSVQGYIEAILERTDLSAAEMSKYLQIIYRNMAYMNKLIDDLFLFSKLDMEKLEFEFETIPAQKFMNDLMEEFRLELEEKQIHFVYTDRLESESLQINIDRKRIHQAIRNIIGNAIKYGPDQGLEIVVTANRQEDMVWLEIGDNGPGIAPDKLAFIFDRFYRIDTERTKDVMSTGLGLAIARELVEAHGGKITVSSIEGEGSCFRIELPVIDPPGREQE